MKQAKNITKNKQKLFGVIAGTLLIVLTIIIPGAQASIEPLPIRGNVGMSYDSESDIIVMFGGWDNSPTSVHSDTWIYDYNDDTYAKKTPSPAPRKRAETDMAYDSLRDKIVLFGGLENFTSAGERDDIWTYDYNLDTWTELFPITDPYERRAHRMVYDSESDKIILFGGMDGLPESTATYYDDTWAYNPANNSWQQMSPALTPLGRSTHYMAYDSESDRVILFGGQNSLSTFFYDTWAYDYNSDTWEELTNVTYPPARASHVMAYDDESDRVVLFGGSTLIPTYSDTWLYDYNNNSWEQQNPATHPSARCRMEVVYDSESDRFVIYGGTTGPYNSLSLIPTDKMWAYDVNTDTWEQMSPTSPPITNGGIPGYNLLFLIGSLFVVVIILSKKLKNRGV